MTRLNERQYKLKMFFWSKSLKNTRQGFYFQLRSCSVAYKLLTKESNSQLINKAFDKKCRIPFLQNTFFSRGGGVLE